MESRSIFENDIWRNGWISPRGKLHPCNLGEHSLLAEELVKYIPQHEKIKYSNSIILESYGWVRLSEREFLTDYFNFRLRAEQKRIFTRSQINFFKNLLENNHTIIIDDQRCSSVELFLIKIVYQ